MRHNLKTKVALFCLSLTLVGLASLLFTGCGMLPKNVEFFQSKVPTYPEKTVKQQETERQTADLIVQKAEETERAALATDADLSVITPAGQTLDLAQALSLSLGPPLHPWKDDSDRLVAILRAQEARQNARLEALRRDLAETTGKKIEGTGTFQVNYFVWVAMAGGGVLLLIFAGVLAFKVFVQSNPIGAAMTAINLPVQAISEVVSAGKKFHTYLDKLDLDDKAKALVKDIWFRAQKEEQSKDSRKYIENLPGAVAQKE